MRALWLLLLLSVGFFGEAVRADDWPQWRGPHRDGISREIDGLAAWTENAEPQFAWRAEVGMGHSSVSIAGGRAYTLGWDGEQDTVYCFDALTGDLIWSQSYPCETIVQWPGPRATPTLHNGVVYTLGQHGQLRSWNADDGTPGWQVDLHEDYNPDVDYGFVWSPLIVEDLLLLNAGSHGLAIRTNDGSIAWGDDHQKSACTSPVPFEFEGQRGVMMIGINADRSAANLVGVDPQSGAELWRYDGWPEQWGAMGVDPIVHEGHVFITSAEQHRRGGRFRIVGSSLEEDWSTERVAAYTSGVVLVEGYLYLVDSGGILKCIDWETGDVVWNERGFDDRGTLIAVGDKLVIQTGAAGDLVLAAASSDGYRELQRLRVFEGDGHTFTPPVLANGRVYCRSYNGEVVCLVTR